MESPNQPQQPQPQPKNTSVVWKSALTGLKWGIYAGIGLKCLDTFVTLLRVDVLVAILFLVATAVCFIPKIGVGVAVALAFAISRFTNANLFLVFLGAALVGAILGALPGMAIGATVGLVRKRAQAGGPAGSPEPMSVIVKSLVLPAVGAVALFGVYFGVVNPWLTGTVVGGDTETSPPAVQQTTRPPTTTVALGSISGRVLDESSKPVEGAYVSATASSGNGGGTAKTDASGRYRIERVASGDYQVWANATGRLVEYWQNASNTSTASMVSVTAPKEKGGIDFTLDMAGTISGTVTDAGGRPLTGIMVVARLTGTNGGWGATTKLDGTYSMSYLPLGSYVVSAQMDSKSTSSDIEYATEYYNDKPGSTSADVVTLSAKTSTMKIDFSLEVGGSISGRVVDANGTPFAGAYVWASAYGSTSSTDGFGMAVDASGNYRLRGLRPGDYRVRASRQGGVAQFWQNTATYASATAVTVASGENKTGINFALKEVATP